MSLAMSIVGTEYYDKVRKTVGTPLLHGGGNQILRQEPPDPAELDALLHYSRPFLITAIGVAGLAGILWLMMFKPIQRKIVSPMLPNRPIFLLATHLQRGCTMPLSSLTDRQSLP